MKNNLAILTALALLTACAGTNNSAQYWQARQLAIADLPPEQRAQAEIELLRDEHEEQILEQAAADERRARIGLAIQQGTAQIQQNLQNATAPGTIGNPIYVHPVGY